MPRPIGDLAAPAGAFLLCHRSPGGFALLSPILFGAGDVCLRSCFHFERRPARARSLQILPQTAHAGDISLVHGFFSGQGSFPLFVMNELATGT